MPSELTRRNYSGSGRSWDLPATGKRKKAPVTMGRALNSFEPSMRPGALHRVLVHCGRVELLLDALEVVQPLDRMVELRAFLLRKLGFHLGDGVGKLRTVELGRRGGDVGEHGQALLRHFGKAAEHDDLLVRAAGGDGEDARADRGHDRRMSGQNAEIAFRAGDVNLIDFAGEGE